MKKLVYHTLHTLVMVFVLLACKPDLKAPAAEKGNIDPSKYVAIGNSITAGYADAALYYDAQLVSYPNLLAQQLREVGGGEFKQPLFPAGSVGAGSTINARLVLGYKTDCKGLSALAPVSLASAGDATALFTNIAAQGPFQNMGVPGAKVTTAVYPGYGDPAKGLGNFNPFFTRMLNSSEYATASMLSKAAEQQPTFFSVFLGNNDVLGYSLNGGASDVITPSSGPVGIGFDASIDQVVNTLSAGGAKGVIGNIPDVTNIPYFTTVPYNGLVLDAASAAALSAAYAPLGISFSEGANPFMIQDAAAPGGMRKMKAGELVLLSTPQDSLKCGGWGSQKPLANKYVLTEAEITQIQTAVAAYNAKIRSLASARGLAFVDVNAFMANARKGIAYNGITVNASFVSGGAFSLDGVHLTPRGNALLANEFIKAINAQYGSNIRQLDVSKYSGVVFP